MTNSPLSLLSTAAATVTANSFNCSGALMLAASVVVFIAAHINDNYSWEDRTWSILPVIYTWIQVYYTNTHRSHSVTEYLSSALSSSKVPASGLPISAATLFGLVITVWGCRLTFNFYRRGGYHRGGEDYRWNHVHAWRIFSKHPLIWTVFNFFIISLFQSWLLWAITLPVMQFSSEPATVKEVCFALVILTLITFEAICDQQQWNFHCQKARTPDAKPYVYGFCVTGVFGYSRHLNVFCEGSIWVMLAVAAQSCGVASLAPWQFAGCAVLEALTLFSTGFITEKLSAEKYPAYEVYQSITPMLFPGISSTTEEVLSRLDAKQRW